MKNLSKGLFASLLLISILIAPYFVFAQNTEAQNMLEEVGEGSGYAKADTTTVSSIAGSIVATALGLLGVIFIILTLYAGFLWMTAQGEEDKIKKAQAILKNSIIGLIIITSVWAIYYFLLPLLLPISGMGS